MQSFRVLCRCKYTGDQVSALFRVAAAQNVRRGGVYENTIGHIVEWSRPWATADDKWVSEPLYIFHLRRGNDGGLWGVEYRVSTGEAAAWAALGRLEEAAFGERVYGAAREVAR